MRTELIMPGVLINYRVKNKDAHISILISVERHNNSTTQLTLTLATPHGVVSGPMSYETLHHECDLVKMCQTNIPKKRERWIINSQ
jgi:hypothetical protein